MKLEDRVKCYGLISALVFLDIFVYLETAYVYSDQRVDNILGYLKYTAGLSALTFGALSLIKPRSIRFNAGWFGVVSGSLFLVVSTYMQLAWVFGDVRVGRILNHLEFTAALSSLIFGLLSFPRWQSLFALAVWAYSFYRFSQPAFGVG